MSNEKEPPKLIVVEGPTGSGKTSYIIDRLVKTGRAKDAVVVNYTAPDDISGIQNLWLRAEPNTLIFVEITTQKPISVEQEYVKPTRYRTRGTPLMHLASEIVEVKKVSEGKHTATWLKSLEHPLKIVEFTTEAYSNVYKYVWAVHYALSTEACVKLLVRLGY